MVLVCHVISADHMINGSCDFVGRSQSRSVTILQILVAMATVIVAVFSLSRDLLKAVSASYLLVCFVRLKENNCETRKCFFISPKKLFLLLR